MRAVALGVRLSGELLAILSGMAASGGPPRVVPMQYTGGTAMTVKTATRAGRATNGMAKMGSAVGMIDTERDWRQAGSTAGGAGGVICLRQSAGHPLMQH